MGRASTKENKNRYHLAREEQGLTREEAADLLEVITADRIEKIENERIDPQPYDVLVMSQGYKKPSLCNYYCSHECPIGKQYVPEVQIKELSAIVIEMLASLNSVNRTKERLIDIADCFLERKRHFARNGQGVHSQHGGYCWTGIYF